MFVTETWLNNKISNSLVCPPGYQVIRHDRAGSRGGGVMVLYRTGLHVTSVNVCTNTNKDYEMLCIDVYDGRKPIRFICLYIPPHISKCSTAIENLCLSLSNLFVHDMPFFVLGDLNFPNIDWTVPISRGDTAHDTFLNFCMSNNLHQCIYESTHEKGNILDLLLTNVIAYNMLLSSTVIGPLSSTCDHFLISCSIKLQNKQNQTSHTQSFRDFKKANYSTIIDQLGSVDWQSIFNSGVSLQLMYDKFISILMQIINLNVPEKVIKSKFKPLKMPLKISKLLKEKMTLYKKYKQDKSLSNEYKMKSKQYDQAVRNWHNSNEMKMCSNPSQKKFFSYVNRKLKMHNEIPPLKTDSGDIILSDEKKANLLNSYFQKVFTVDNGTCPNIPHRHTTLMENFAISPSDVFTAVKNCKDKVSRTPEGIPAFFIKRVISAIIYPLTTLFNLSLSSGAVPKQWKEAIVIPVFKKGDRSSPKNYRPISQTSSFCRIFESILFKNILTHLNSNSLLSPHQFGFLPGRSTCSQLLNCLNKWYQNFCENKPTNVVYTDIAKAFDSVSHQKLLEVIKSYGLNQTVCTWIKSFLMGRSQQVAIGNRISSALSVISGVPQGSVLGPLLFLIYINDLCTCNIELEPRGGVALFADDAKIYSHEYTNLQNSLNCTNEWLQNFQLNLASQKCIHLQIKKPSLNIQQPPLYINNSEIQGSSSVKDLGVYISNDLKWSTHINHISNLASSQSYLILRSFSSRNIWVLLSLFKTYVRPKLEYNTSVWSPYLAKDIEQIESVQRQFTKFAFRRCGIPYKSYQDRLYKVNLKSLQYCRIVYDIILFLKYFLEYLT